VLELWGYSGIKYASFLFISSILFSFQNQLNLPEFPPDIDEPMDYHFKLPVQFQDVSHPSATEFAIT
jgi:hypothetical protein